MWSDQDRAFLRDRKEIQREEVTCPFSGKTKIWIPVDQPPHTTSFGCHQDCCLEICTWKVRRKYGFLISVTSSVRSPSAMFNPPSPLPGRKLLCIFQNLPSATPLWSFPRYFQLSSWLLCHSVSVAWASRTAPIKVHFVHEVFISWLPPALESELL